MNYKESDRIPMQLISFEVRQRPDFEHDEVCAGAFVLCWIKDQTSTNAAYVARGWIEASGWEIVKDDDHSIVTDEDYESDDDHRQYFEQALVDEEVFLYLTYDKEDEKG